MTQYWACGSNQPVYVQYNTTADVAGTTGVTSWEVHTNSTTAGSYTWTLNYDYGENYQYEGHRERYQTRVVQSSHRNLRLFYSNNTGTAQNEFFDGPAAVTQFSTFELDVNGRCTLNTDHRQPVPDRKIEGIPYMKYHEIKRRVMEPFKILTSKQVKKLPPKLAELYEARIKSEKLLKMMLSTHEYNSLKNRGEVEIPHPEDENVIFIVKRESSAMVERKKKNGEHIDRQCIVTRPEHQDIPYGDKLLQKILLIKSDVKEFERIAIAH